MHRTTGCSSECSWSHSQRSGGCRHQCPRSCNGLVSTPNASFLMASQPWGRRTDAHSSEAPQHMYFWRRVPTPATGRKYVPHVPVGWNSLVQSLGPLKCPTQYHLIRLGWPLPNAGISQRSPHRAEGGHSLILPGPEGSGAPHLWECGFPTMGCGGREA